LAWGAVWISMMATIVATRMFEVALAATAAAAAASHSTAVEARVHMSSVGGK
jgi:hypothetical protein